MSKVVTIPKDRNPFVVIVNGVKYSYPAGVSTEVPDEVADVIEKYVGAKPKPDPNAGINFGGTQSDWNQTDSSAADFIKNKPFYDSPTGGDTLYWDGNTEGLVNFDGFYFKVSDAIPTMDELSNGVRLSGAGEVIDIPIEEIVEISGAIVCGERVLVIPCDNYDASELMEEENAVFPEAGIYFPGVAIAFELVIPGYTGFPVTKKMEEKYLPGPVILYADAENYLYATRDTSDTSKRMTKEELRQLQQSGLAAYVDDTAETYWAIVGYYFAEEYGEADVMLNIPGSPTMMAFYTAEYTAS